MKKSGMIIGVVVLVVIVGAVFIFAGKKHTPTTSSTSANTSAASSNVQAAATITYSDNGFSPATITVKSGDTVAIKNTSSGDMQLDSDPHPVHTDDSDLNVGVVASGQTQTFTVTKKGTFGYHNHLVPSDTGKIIIE